MAASPEIKRFGEHRNAFGFLRLLFATLVIVAHTPELADGNRHRELLSGIFGTISFGELAVDGFFLISGYLIVGSWLKEPKLWRYMRKRVARIYPGFMVASLVCILIVAPLGGAHWPISRDTFVMSAARMIALKPPEMVGPFAGTPYAALNGSTWTISIEFRCYVLVLVLGLLGAYRRPWLVPLLALSAWLAFACVPGAFWWTYLSPLPLSGTIVGVPEPQLRLTAIFLAGACFQLGRDHIRFDVRASIVAAAGLVLCLFHPMLADVGIATFGAYLLFGFAQWGRAGLLASINNRDDISYGVYLYGWPIGKLVLWYWPQLSLFAVGAATIAGACLCGWLSWHGIEKPVMKHLR